ncbi:hypothetical protein ES332_D10G137200v1 [Gossypium tomentosum]|uniref:C3H1-type domain-containing protein n=1 Tax=Gossypium tomentosum TaxID=34277 RepID=A0A5D2J5A7_GOSTO|nr:hypothetical protein ES332_D10G137200v1 [Gossypium tomentosum]
MDVHGRERKLAGNNGEFSYSKANDIFLRNPNPSHNSSLSTLKSPDHNKLCKYWMSGHCHRGDKCWYLHSWSRGDGFTMLAKLEGHKKALPSGHDKLYSGSSDGTARIWDGHTGKCLHFTNLGDEAGSLITEGAWVFIGMKNAVKVGIQHYALNIHSDLELNLKGPVGQVYAMIVAGDMLFAGHRASCETDSFQLPASLEGHNGAVSCLAVGDKMLFSGSLDKTIRVCSSASLVCGTLTHFNALRLHADVVTSLVHCNGYLFSSSVDCTIKVWFATEGQNWRCSILIKRKMVFSHYVE